MKGSAAPVQPPLTGLLGLFGRPLRASHSRRRRKSRARCRGAGPRWPVLVGADPSRQALTAGGTTRRRTPFSLGRRSICGMIAVLAAGGAVTGIRQRLAYLRPHLIRDDLVGDSEEPIKGVLVSPGRLDQQLCSGFASDGHPDRRFSCFSGHGVPPFNVILPRSRTARTASGILAAAPLRAGRNLPCRTRSPSTFRMRSSRT